MVGATQLPLPFGHRPGFSAADFVEVPSNQAVLAWLGRTADWPAGRLLLWGGYGKTHLLHVWAERSGAVVWDGASLRGLPDLPERGGIALDDADTTTDEAALFHLLNAAGEAGLPVLLAGQTPPSRWPTRLPDLASRLRAITTVEIGPPDDLLLHVVLARLLADRQLAVPEAVQDWLLRRLPRTAAALRGAVARLDEASLAGGRAITRPLAATVLADVIEGQAHEISGTVEGHSRHRPPSL
jgi:chromosomal replication initiation ATPase DnaA